MPIGTRIRKRREEKKLSQGDLEERTGLLRCYISRVENGHTVPSLATLEKFALGLEVPLYLLVYDGGEPPPVLPHLSKRQSMEELDTDQESKEEMRFFEKLHRLVSRTDKKHRRLLLSVAQEFASLSLKVPSSQ